MNAPYSNDPYANQAGFAPVDRPPYTPPPAGIEYGYAGPVTAPPAGAVPGHGYAVPLLPPPGSNLALAEPGKRLAARLIDGLILIPVILVFLCPFFAAVVRDMPAPSTSTARPSHQQIPTEALGAYLYGVAAALIVVMAYETVCVAVWDATVGKKAMKLVVLRVEDGGRLGWGQALGRAGSYHLLNLVNILSLLDALWLLWDQPNRQTLHDKMAGTIVIRTDAAPYGPRAVLNRR